MAAGHWQLKELHNLDLIPDFLILLDFMGEERIFMMIHS